MTEKIGSDVVSSPKDTIPTGLRFSGNPFAYKQKNKEKVLSVLAENSDRWWTITPLAEEIEAGFQSVRNILMELTLEGKVVKDSSSGRTYFKLNKNKAKEDLVNLWKGKKEEVKEEHKDDENRFALCPFCGILYNTEHYRDGHDCEERKVAKA